MYEEDFLCTVTPPSCRPDSTDPFTGEYWDMIFDEVMEGVYNETSMDTGCPVQERLRSRMF